MSRLCQECLGIIRALDAERPDCKLGRVHWQRDHHRSLGSFLAAARETCLICHYLETRWPRREERATGFSTTCRCFHFNDNGMILYFGLAGEEPIHVHLRFVDEDRVALRDGEEAVAANTGDERVLTTARAWMDYCRANHPDCVERDSQQTYRPSRLIDLCPPDLPAGRYWRLIDDTSGLSGSYATLSHRWGSGPPVPFKLTRSTYEDMTNGLPFSCLSGTYRDAMRVVRRLGLRYIWIDSLCVSQDPETLDIQVAAYRMADVYGHSFCNIATLTARQDTIFSSRDPRFYSPAATMLSACRYGLRDSYAVLLARQWENSVLEAPLSRRAWILQEQLLPGRMLYFGEQQMLWSCSEGSFCELYPLDDITFSWLEEGMYEGDLGSLRSSLSDAIDAMRPGSSSATTKASANLGSLWWDLLGLYTQRHLTFAEDKLLAIAGVVHLLTSPSNRKDTIVGGLMTSELPGSLLWMSDHATVRQRGYEKLRLSPVHRAPSWSWAYYDGQIAYFLGDDKATLPPGRPVAHVVEIETETTAIDGVEVIKGGDLHLLAASLPLEPQPPLLGKSKRAGEKTWLMPFATSLPMPSPYSGTNRALKLVCAHTDTVTSPSSLEDDINGGGSGGSSRFDGKIVFDLTDYSALSDQLTAVFIEASTQTNANNPDFIPIYRFDGLILRRHPKRGSTSTMSCKEIYERVGVFKITIPCSSEPDLPMTKMWHFSDSQVRQDGDGSNFTPYDFESAAGFMREFIIG